MRAGELRHRVTIERFVVTQNEHGQDVRTARVVAVRRARVYARGSREFANVQHMQSDATHLVVLRWLPDVTTEMQVIWHDGNSDRTLAIDGPPINPDGLQRELQLLCKES